VATLFGAHLARDQDLGGQATWARGISGSRRPCTSCRDRERLLARTRQL